MKFYTYRNFTVENLFAGFDMTFSGYGDISEVPNNIDSYIWFYIVPLKMNQQELIEEINGFTNKFNYWYTQIPSNKTIVVFTLCSLIHNRFENSDFSIVNAIDKFNANIIEYAKANSNIKIVDFQEFIDQSEIPILDWKHYYISQSFINIRLSKKFKHFFSKKLSAFKSERKKCIVLDLDNTLWGGILGEDGYERIQVGDTYPGLAYRDFQENILEAIKNGIIIAICSKNNLEDVQEAWQKNPFILIKEHHLSAFRINWQEKYLNIIEIATELNIGLDSIVFIDDNPLEREKMKEMLPDVVVPDFPEQPYLLSSFFFKVYNDYFQIYKLTSEDKSKTNQYLANAVRNSVRQSFSNEDEYLESLGIEIQIINANEMSIPRIAQMTSKTNQFNLTTKRYTESEILIMVEKKSLVQCLSVKDRFGDNGITVAAFVNINDSDAEIDSFLLSCRILGRNIETAYMNFLINHLIKSGIKSIRAKYIPSKKNKQTEEFYDKLGFRLINIDNDGTRNYTLDNLKLREIKPYYKFSIT